MSKFKYVIDPEKTYTLIYNDDNGDSEYEVTGEEILAQFRRESFLENLINQINKTNQHESLLDDLREL